MACTLSKDDRPSFDDDVSMVTLGRLELCVGDTSSSYSPPTFKSPLKNEYELSSPLSEEEEED